jgi:hypothetical protein
MDRAALVVCLVLLPPAVAGAQEAAPRAALDAAIAHAEDADFASALAAFEEAEAGASLDRGALVRLFAHRATVHFALGELAAMEADLTRLLALDPEATPPTSAPPPVHDALLRLRGSVQPPALEAAVHATGTGLEVRAHVREGGADLVRGLRAWGRAEGGTWSRGEGGVVSITAAPGTEVEWYAEAIGPGGAVVASTGDAASPRHARVPLPPPAPGGSDDTAWWLIGGGAAAMVIGAVVAGIAVAATQSGPGTTVGGPGLVSF